MIDPAFSPMDHTMSSLSDFVLMGLRDQSTDFFALQRYELFIVVVPVELRAKIYGMNSRIVAFHNKKVRRLQ